MKRNTSRFCFEFAAAMLLSGLAAAQTSFRIDFDRGTSPIPGIMEEIKTSPAAIPEVPELRGEDAQTAAPITVPALPPGTNKRFVKPFNNGFVNAVRRLREPKCAAFFGSGAELQFVSAGYRFTFMGAPVVNEQGNVQVVGAAAFHNPDWVFINSQGPFVTPRMFVPGKSGLQTVDMGTNLRGADFSALLLLHELGHLVGNFVPDAGDNALNTSNSKAVLKNCY